MDDTDAKHVKPMTRSTAPRVFCCAKWGKKFGASYVNRLFRAVSANMTGAFTFVCMTDDDSGLDPGIRAISFPDFGPPKARWSYNRGNWAKLALFAPDLFDDDAIVLYTDLDVMILDALDPFFDLVEAKGGFYELREWNPTLLNLLPMGWRPDRGGQGSIFCWRVREQRHMYTHFRLNWPALQDAFFGDGPYFAEIAWKPRYLPHDWAVSFKRHCLSYTPLGFGTTKAVEPKRGRVLVFHGTPTPETLVPDGDYRWGSKRRSGRGPVPWIQAYWRRYE